MNLERTAIQSLLGLIKAGPVNFRQFASNSGKDFVTHLQVDIPNRAECLTMTESVEQLRKATYSMDMQNLAESIIKLEQQMRKNQPQTSVHFLNKRILPLCGYSSEAVPFGTDALRDVTCPGCVQKIVGVMDEWFRKSTKRVKPRQSARYKKAKARAREP